MRHTHTRHIPHASGRTWRQERGNFLGAVPSAAVTPRSRTPQKAKDIPRSDITEPRENTIMAVGRREIVAGPSTTPERGAAGVGSEEDHGHRARSVWAREGSWRTEPSIFADSVDGCSTQPAYLFALFPQSLLRNSCSSSKNHAQTKKVHTCISAQSGNQFETSSKKSSSLRVIKKKKHG